MTAERGAGGVFAGAGAEQAGDAGEAGGGRDGGHAGQIAGGTEGGGGAGEVEEAHGVMLKQSKGAPVRSTPQPSSAGPRTRKRAKL